LTAGDVFDLSTQSRTPLEIPNPPPPPPPPQFIANTAARGSSELVQSFNRRALYLVNGAGLSGTVHTTSPDGAMWLTTGGGCCGGTPPTDFDPEVTFDLGAVYDVATMRVWNYNEGGGLTSRGAATVDIYVAGEDGLFDLHQQNVALTQAPGTTSDFNQAIDLEGIRARYVKLSITGTHGADNNFAGLSEVQFDGNFVSRADIPATIHQVSSELAGFGDRGAGNLVDHSGQVGRTHDLNPDQTMWLNNGTLGAPNDLAPEVTFDLGGEFFVDHMNVWNYNEFFVPSALDFTSRGVATADIQVAG
jgi:hypothetical protein